MPCWKEKKTDASQLIQSKSTMLSKGRSILKESGNPIRSAKWSSFKIQAIGFPATVLMVCALSPLLTYHYIYKVCMVTIATMAPL
jgi:hypothetical protein